MQQLELSRANRLKLARAFKDTERVDMSIDCVIEGQMGGALVDDRGDLRSFQIQVGPFNYFAGEVSRAMLENLPPYSLIMSAPEGWIAMAREVHGRQLVQFPRYSFSSESLSGDRLDRLVQDSPFRERIVPIDIETATEVYGQSDHFLDLSAYDSAEDFLQRGIGYVLRDSGKLVAAAFASLICSRGAELSLYVGPEYRRKGIAVAMSAVLILHCLRDGLKPNWDAANVESCLLAEKLGYVQTGTYDAYFLRGD